MARPLQHVYRRRQLHGGEDEEEVEDGQGYRKAQALPIADLPENFDGEVEDGATYLALAK